MPVNLIIILFLPLIGGTVLLLFRKQPELCRRLGLAVALAELILVFSLFLITVSIPGEMVPLVIDLPWVPALGIHFFLVLDGISLSLVLLTAWLIVLCMLVSWGSVNAQTGVFHFALLFNQFAVMGVFLAGDPFLFFLFWEIQLLPLFFLIGLWGSAHRVGATVKFFLFSMAGSLFMLLALVGLYVYHADPAGAQIVGRNIDAWLFGAFVLAVAVKIPLIGLHTWLPDAQSASPTAANIILAGLLLNTGAYALLRFGFPLFPAAAHNAVPLLLLLGLFGMVYFAWIAHAQQELKRMVAYAGIAHMSLIVVGLAVWNPMALTGAVVQMINQGLTIPALFILVGMLEERAPNRDLADFRGLWARMPLFSGFFLLFAMSAVGLPGLNHFIGEILILIGAFHKWPIVGIVGFAGLILTLVFVLGRVQTLLFGPAPEAVPAEDITGRELAILIPLAVAVLWIGLFPGTLLDLLAPELSRLADQLGGGLHSQPISPPGAR